jgi:hypothetical protein
MPAKGQRTFQCLDCERPDPIKSDALKWLFEQTQATSVKRPNIGLFQPSGLI